MIDQNAVAPESYPIPGLLPWQSYFLVFVLGIFAFRYPVPAFVALVVLGVADTTFRGWLRRLPPLAFILCAVFGYGYALQRAPEPVDIPVWVESRKPVMVRGVVDRADPRAGSMSRIILRDLHCQRDGLWEPLSGKLTWTWRKPDYTPTPGQSMEALMRVQPVRSFGNPGGWDYAWYWQRQGVFWRGWVYGKKTRIAWGDRPEDIFWTAKTWLREAVAEHVPDTQGGAMVRALVTGDKSALDSGMMQETRGAGLAHTLALSGLHVGFVAGFGFALAWLAGWLYPPLLLSIPRPKLAVLLAAPLVLGYAWLGQPSASLVRAATMYGFWGILLLQGRGRVLMDGLFFALAAIVFVSPLSVFDLSLQMSAVAVAGIGLLYPRIRPFFYLGGRWWHRLIGWAGGLLAISVCANVSLLPLVSWYFGTWSPNILLNLVWLPVLGFAVMPLGVLGMIFSAMGWSEALGTALLGFASSVMDQLLALLHGVYSADMTPVFAALRPLWPEVVGCALLLVVGIIAWANRRVCLGLAGLGFLLMVFPHVSIMVADSQDEVRLTLLDVGLGQAALISTPGGHRWLVDGGGGTSRFDIGESVVAPFLTLGRPPRLDGIFMSHPDVDHSHGLPFILSRFRVDHFYTNGMLPRGLTGKRMRTVLDDGATKPVPLYAGQQVALGDGIAFDVVHPASDYKSRRANERSLILRLVRDGKGLALLPGDVELDGINALLASGRDIRAEVLVLPHHGSRSSFSPEFYRRVAPDATLCSNGYLNRYGFPHSEVVQGVGVPVFSTSDHGQVSGLWTGDLPLSVRAFHP